MLTTHQLTKLYEEGVSIIYRRNGLRGCSGLFDPGTLEATIYLPAPSPKERQITLLHELIHARDGQKGARIFNTRLDDDVEKEAQQTFKKNPELIQFIVALWKLPY
tara:strand:- start:60942 stop:61259 length:318 start_codon:yes stop_codon:yes gene_type:complete